MGFLPDTHHVGRFHSSSGDYVVDYSHLYNVQKDSRLGQVPKHRLSPLRDIPVGSGSRLVLVYLLSRFRTVETFCQHRAHSCLSRYRHRARNYPRHGTATEIVFA